MWYLAIVMAISLVFSFVLYRVATGELQRGLNHETQRIYNQFPVFENNPILRPTTDFDDGAHRILLRLIGFNLIVLVTAGGASYWLAKRTLEPIEEAHEQQKRFTADVSHELRTPLTALRMESEVALLNKKASSKDLRNTLSSNLEEVGKLESLINNLLRLSRLEADELQQGFTNLSSKELVQAAVRQVSTLAKARKTTIKTSGDSAIIFGDQDALVQLLVILLDNAIKYSEDNSQVTVNSVVVGGHLNLEVIDHGDGIDHQSLEHLFDRFYRADQSRQKSGEQGFGLGLSIAKMIADLHEANIVVTSQPNHGTTVTVTLAKANAGQPPTKPAKP